MSVQEEREPWWISADGRIAIYNDGVGPEWGTYSLWYDVGMGHALVIEGTLTSVCNYYQAEFYPG
jgi:hypothetical protein